MDDDLHNMLLEGEAPLILIAHRDEGVRAMLVEQLSEYRLQIAADGTEAHALATAERPNVVIADAALPGWGGVELCRRLKADPLLETVPVAITTEPAEQSFEEALEAGAAEVIAVPFFPAELRLRIWNLVRGQLYQRELERKNHVIIEALNDLKESEEMLIQAAKLSMLGEMSAGIVHEINNPLNYAKSALFLVEGLVKDMPDGEFRRELVDLVGDLKEGFQRMGLIVRDLRTFAVKGMVDMSWVDLREVVNTAARLIGDRLSTVRYVQDLPEGMLVWGNENSLCQVVLNLIKNGVEATEGEGRTSGGAEVRVSGDQSDHEVVICVRDNGCGIPALKGACIYEPFFTTKERGRGMGLGLSISKRILNDHGATIEVESVEGEFTEFTLRFPTEVDRGLEILRSGAEDDSVLSSSDGNATEISGDAGAGHTIRR